MTVRLTLRLRAAFHELRCRECRVTWASLFQRLLGVPVGYSPSREQLRKLDSP